MTNCWLTGGDTGRFTGGPAPGTGADATIPALTSGTLPAYRYHNTFHTSALHDSLLHPLLHFTFVLAAAAPRFDGFREMVFTESACKTLCRAGASEPMI